MSANSVFNNRFTTKTVFVQDRLLEKRNHSSFLCETKIKLPKTRANQQKKQTNYVIFQNVNLNDTYVLIYKHHSFLTPFYYNQS